MVYQLLCGNIPSSGTCQWDGGTTSQNSSQEVDILYLYYQDMSANLKVLLLRIPHLEYMLKQLLVWYHTGSLKEF